MIIIIVYIKKKKTKWTQKKKIKRKENSHHRWTHADWIWNNLTDGDLRKVEKLLQTKRFFFLSRKSCTMNERKSTRTCLLVRSLSRSRKLTQNMPKSTYDHCLAFCVVFKHASRRCSSYPNHKAQCTLSKVTILFTVAVVGLVVVVVVFIVCWV